MVPGAAAAHLDDIGREGLGPAVEGGHLTGFADALARRWEARAEHIGDVYQPVLFADGALHPRLAADAARGPDELGVGVADLVPRQASLAVLGDERTPGQPVVDDSGAGSVT